MDRGLGARGGRRACRAWPLYAAHLDRAADEAPQPRLETPRAGAGWSLEPKPVTDWRPNYDGAASSVFQTYRKGDRVVALYVALLPDTSVEGAELVTSTNVMVVQKHPVWSNVGRARAGRRPRHGRRSALRADPASLAGAAPAGLGLVPHLRARADQSVSRESCCFARNKLLDRGDDGAAIILAAPYEGEPEDAAETLREFAREMTPSIDAELARVSETRRATPGR